MLASQYEDLLEEVSFHCALIKGVYVVAESTIRHCQNTADDLRCVECPSKSIQLKSATLNSDLSCRKFAQEQCAAPT